MNNNHIETKTLMWFAIGLTLATVLYFFGITWIPVPAQNRDFANIVLGFMAGTGFSAVVGYYFGGSKSGNDKDASIKAMAENQPKTAENAKPDTDVTNITKMDA